MNEGDCWYPHDDILLERNSIKMLKYIMFGDDKSFIAVRTWTNEETVIIMLVKEDWQKKVEIST